MVRRYSGPDLGSLLEHTLRRVWALGKNISTTYPRQLNHNPPIDICNHVLLSEIGHAPLPSSCANLGSKFIMSVATHSVDVPLEERHSVVEIGVVVFDRHEVNPCLNPVCPPFGMDG